MNPKSFIASNQKSPWLITALAVSFPLLFVNALSESYPMGYAGLFTQMARQIADANFQLPIESPFYGPGGIPFAYPPFGLYLLAILIKVTGKYFFFLRILPPMLSLISLIPLFYLTLHLSKSTLAAGMIVILTAASPNLYEAHAWAAGMVRASAFLFMLCTLYFFVKHNSQPTLLNLLSAGMLLGLTLLSHLTYFLFCIAWIGWWTVSSGKFFLRFKDAAIVVLLGLLTSSIWWLTIIFRYGFGVFVKAFNSHGADSLLSVWQNVPGIFASFWINLESLTANIWLFALVVIGVIALVVKKNLQLILF